MFCVRYNAKVVFFYTAVLHACSHDLQLNLENKGVAFRLEIGVSVVLSNTLQAVS